MVDPTIHGNRPVFSALLVLQALGGALEEIKKQDKLTWEDVGAVLGKSDDQAAKYADAAAEMGIVTFARGKREWGSRFTGPFDRLCEESGVGAISDRACECAIVKAAARLSEALVTQDDVTLEFVRKNRSIFEAARDAIEVQLHKLRPAA